MKSLRHSFQPRPIVAGKELSSGLRWLTMEGMVSSGFGTIVGGSFLTAFALALGANNFHIGVMAAIPFLIQPLQIPAILLVERLRWRKAIVVLTFLPNQLLWLSIALIPFFIGVPGRHAVAFLLGVIAIRSIISAVTNCAWNSWIRDLVPQEVLGRFFARRTALSVMVSMAVGLGAALYADFWRVRSPDAEVMGYTIPLLLGVLTLGLAGPLCMSMMPEPRAQLAPPGDRQSAALATLGAPFRDANYRRLLRFLLLWGFAVNLATPFYSVYMLERLGLPLSGVMILATIGQVFHILFLRLWGPFTDRFGVKGVLSVSASLYLLVIFGWTFTTMPDPHALTIPLLVLLHIGSGIAASGVGLTTGTVGMKLAPRGKATAYLAAAGLAGNIGSGLGPLIGGYFADFFTAREFGLALIWNDPGRSLHFPALNLSGFDFLFVLAFILGLIGLDLLRGLREEGETKREVVLEALAAGGRVPSLGGANRSLLHQFPFAYLTRFPLPGFDVAVGVAAYQLSEASRGAVYGWKRAARGADTARESFRRGPLRRLRRLFRHDKADAWNVFWEAGYHDRSDAQPEKVPVEAASSVRAGTRKPPTIGPA